MIKHLQLLQRLATWLLTGFKGFAHEKWLERHSLVSWKFADSKQTTHRLPADDPRKDILRDAWGNSSHHISRSSLSYPASRPFRDDNYTLPNELEVPTSNGVARNRPLEIGSRTSGNKTYTAPYLNRVLSDKNIFSYQLYLTHLKWLLTKDSLFVWTHQPLCAFHANCEELIILLGFCGK